MSVKLIDNECFYGYRVRRTVNGDTTQEYYPLRSKVSGNKLKLNSPAARGIKKKCVARDEELKALQVETKQANKVQRCFRDDGSIRGISYILKKEKSGNQTPIFQVGTQSEIIARVFTTSFSIKHHGAKEAWKKAVRSLCEHKELPISGSGSGAYRKMLKAMPEVAQ